MQTKPLSVPCVDGHRKRRIQSTNKLFPENMDPNDPDSRFEIRWAPSEFKHSSLSSLRDDGSSYGKRSADFFGISPQIANGVAQNTELHESPYSREKLGHMKLNARGFQASIGMFEMWGDRPPAKAKSSSYRSERFIECEEGLSPKSTGYRLGCDLDMGGNFSFKPDLNLGSVITPNTDDSMAIWEAELFRTYRKMKYYGEEELSREKTKDIVTRFTDAAHQAYDKLESAAQSEVTSEGFKNFFSSLNGFEALTKSGFANLDDLFEGKVPDNLPDVYSFLHVAYAISKTTLQGDSKDTIEEFQQDILNWRECLPIGVGNLGYCERQVFDELMTIMRLEIDEALQWISERTHLSIFTNLIDDDETSTFEASYLPQLDLTNTMYQDGLFGQKDMPEARPSSFHQMPKPPEAPMTRSGWISIVRGTIFRQVVKFLEDLDGLGSIFRLLCGLPHFALRGRYKNDISANAPNLSHQLQSSIAIFQRQLETFVVQPTLQLGYSFLCPVFQTALEMVTQGAVDTLRDFENYVLCLAKVNKPSSNEYHSFLRLLLFHCARSSYAAGILPCRIKWTHQPEYTQFYLMQRLQMESMDTEGQELMDTQRSTPQTTPDLLSVDENESWSPVDDVWWLGDTEEIPGSFDANIKLESPLHVECEISENLSLPSSAASSPTFVESNESPKSHASSQSSPKPRRKAQRKRSTGGRKFICDVPGCGIEICGSKYTMSNSNLLRHKRSAHPETIANQEYLCDIPGCKARYCGARGKENLKTHMRLRHKLPCK